MTRYLDAFTFFERPLTRRERLLGLLRPLSPELFRFLFPETSARIVFHACRRRP